MKIATLGPQGTFSHEAAARLEPRAEIIFQRTIRDAVEYVSANRDSAGLVPLENSVSGTVGETLDALTESDLQIEREVIHPVIHHLAVKGETDRITTILAHPQSYSQCEKFIRSNYAEAHLIHTSSNGKSAEMLRDTAEKSWGAIVPELAIQLYGLRSVHSRIQDNRYNVTRFVFISRNSTKPSGYDRTSLSLYPQVDYPGLLHEMLGHLSSRGVNLSKIESRPSKGRLGDYIFYMDLQGHQSDERVAEAIEALKKMAFVRVLGSYPRQY
ncbi:MAG: prephenate dehydratase [Candidatus Glassbacteria bacterium]